MSTKPVDEIVQNIRDRITHKYVVINRLPLNTFDTFKKLSDEEFCGDYGFTLKHLVDFYIGLIPSGIEHLEDEIMLLRLDIDKINQGIKDSKNVSKKKTKTRIDGTKIE